MTDEQVIGEIRDANLSYLMLAQTMLRKDRASAMFRLGIDQDLAGIVERLTPAQTMKMASTNMLLCRLHCDDSTILRLLTDHGTPRPMMESHAAILMAAREPATLV